MQDMSVGLFQRAQVVCIRKREEMVMMLTGTVKLLSLASDRQ